MVDLEVELARSTAGPRAARRALTRWSAERLDREVLADAQLLVTEIATNAVLHGKGPITLHATLDDERLRVEVADEGPGFVRTLRSERVDRLGGWGLEFVEEMSWRWGVREDSTHVWIELERSRPRVPHAGGRASSPAWGAANASRLS